MLKGTIQKLLTASVIAVGVMATEGLAAQKSDPFQVKLNVNSICRVAAPDMNFGTVAQVTGTETASTQISVWCNNGVLFLVSFSSTALVSAVNSTLIGQTAGNTVTIPFQINKTGFFGIGTGHAPANAINFPVTGTLTATPGAVPDTYTRQLTAYVIY
jgi:spore coat protein U-like protein